MKKIINICLLLMCQLALFGQARIGDNPDYNPTNPGDPQVPEITYGFSTAVSPVGAGSTNFSGTTKYAEGKSVNVRAYSNTGYQFIHWMLGDSVVSTSASFNYTMPARNVTLTAVFKYNPSSPADPDSLGLKYDLKVVASPKQGGSFNVSNTEVQEGHYTNLYAYPNTGFRFKGWQLDGEIVSTASPYKYTMGDKDVTITGLFEYNPSNPSNPGKNSWNKTTGEVIVDDFTAGSLYNAINQATGGDNSSVTMITVSGRMSSNDFSIANNFSNCTMVDLKRTYGYTDVPDYAYDYNTALTSIILPASIENIGYRAFYQASNLADVTCYAITPPAVESYAFKGIAEGAVLHVLSAAIPLYAEAEGWKDFTILPLTEEVNALEVNLSAGSEDGRYKNMTLELVNTESGQKQKYVISDRVTYTFNGLLKKSIFNVYVKNNMGAVLGKIENISIEDKDVSVTFESLLQPQNITLSVQTPDGTDVTSQTQIRWFDSADEYLQQGNKLSGLLAGTAVRYSVKLPQALGMQYVLPTDSVYTIQEQGNALVCTLQPLEEVTISGRVKDITTSSALSGAVVSVSQKLNGLYSKAFTVKTDNKGGFTIKVFNDQSTITVSASDYLNQTLEFANFNDTTFVGEVALKGITGATITTSFTYRTSVEEGAVSEIQNWYTDYANVAYEIYNETQQRAITQFNVQYPSIVLLEEVAEGDVLKLTASSRTNAFVPVKATATIDAHNRAETIFDIVELGGIRAKFTSTDNASVVGILYDGKGQLLKKYTYGNASLSISNLADGDYTLVSMTNSTLFNSILNLSQFAASGLKEGTDYVQNTVTVKSGVIATVSNDLIPVLDESKLYYTGNNTLFSVNKTSIVAGNYLTLKGKIDFKSAYSSKVSNVSMVVDLPESCSFVENSVMVGSTIASYTLDGSRLTIPLTGKYTDQVRFCVIPTAGGDYAPNAFAQFTLDNKEVLQPIGNAKFAVKDLTISVPSTVAKTTIPISGTALGNSTIEVYDNGVKIGETTSLANGVWSTTCELDEPYNLSTHSIYAKVTTKQGLELQSETQQCMYDKNAIEVKTVTMINISHRVGNYYEEKTVFDFQNPPKSIPAYWYWPDYPEFTFLIDFTNNDTTVVSNVILYVETTNGNHVPLKATYNDKKGLWIASGEFGDWGNYDIPTNVSVDFDAKTIIELDREHLNELNEEVKIIIEETDKKYQSEIELLTDLETELSKENYSIIRINYLVDVICGYEPNDGIVLTPEQLEFADNTSNYLFDVPYNQVDESFVNSISNIGKPFNTPITIESQNLGNGVITPKIEIIPNESNKSCMLDNSWNIGDDFSYSDNKVVFMNENGDVMTVDFQSIKNLPMDEASYSDFIAYENEMMSNVSDFWEPYNGLVDFANVAYLGDKKLNKLMLLKLQSEGVNSSNMSKWMRTVADRKNIVGKLGQLDKAGKILGPLGAVINGVDTGISGFGIWNDNKTWDALRDAISKSCTKEAADDLNKKLESYRKWLQKRNWVRTGLKGISTGLSVGGVVAAPETFGVSLVLFGAGLGVGKFTDWYQKQYQQTNKNNWNDLLDDIKGKGADCKDFPWQEEYPKSPFNPVEGVHDPSGYVYEGVSSNRIEGVMASCYYKETVEDMYGDLHENIVLWDAEQYAQENPLFTDENGMYRWDVPQGLWQVKFEKEGYQTTYSEWLPVPPPQLEVNIAMTQNKQPEVKVARAYEDGIEVEFDKYMQLDGLTTENIFVTKNGETAAGTVKLLNEEQAYENNPITYASKVRFVPETSFLTTDEVTLTVSRKVKSYAGIQMGEDYTQSFDIEKEVKSIVADSLIKVDYNGDKEITVSALPYDAAIGKKMIVNNSSSMIATISADTLIFDENGQARLTLNGDLPGTAMLTFTLAETDVKALSTVQVVIPELKMTAVPQATRASGTAVYRGTEVGLTCETEGAVIYYTLDGSCPCDENAPRQIYKTPIAITEDMTIKAMAVVDEGDESEVAEFSFTIKRTNLGMELKEGWNWVSHNMETEVPTTALPQNATRIVGQTAELVNDPVYGLVGNLKTLQPDEAYKVQMSTDSVHVMSGYEFNPATSIDLKSGWNWLGYPVNQTMSLSEAFANMQPDNEDYIVGQDGFAQYADGAWTGTLQTLNPGMGYLYHSQSDKAFAYNGAIVSKARAIYGLGIKNETPWAVDKNKYPNVMPLIADIYVDGQKMSAGSYAVGAFCGMECRGVGKYVNGKLMMNIYGEGNEKITFRAVNNETEEVFDVIEQISFEETLMGSLNLPFALHVGESTGISEIERNWNVWPAVPSDYLYLSLNDKGFDRVTLTDVNGKVALVKTHVMDGEAIYVAPLIDGIYIVTAVQQGNVYYKKIMKTSK